MTRSQPRPLARPFRNQRPSVPRSPDISPDPPTGELSCHTGYPDLSVTPSSAHEFPHPQTPQPIKVEWPLQDRVLPCLAPISSGCSWPVSTEPTNGPFVRGQRIIRMFAQCVKANRPRFAGNFRSSGNIAEADNSAAAQSVRSARTHAAVGSCNVARVDPGLARCQFRPTPG
jgi:hypothetical protein